MAAVSPNTVLDGSSAKIRIGNSLPETQRQLLLHKAREPYELLAEGKLPQLSYGELLVEIHAIGLNPIDWKSAKFGFGLPELPCLNGREFVGKIVTAQVEDGCPLRPGEWVLAVSTDYRDFRKSAFQEFAVVCCYNAIRIPHHVDPYRVAAVGVAFVAASLALSACLGVTFTKGEINKPFNLRKIAQQSPELVPSDIHDEVFEGISPGSWAQPGEWILIYGASTITAQVTIQLAKKAGLKVAGVADLSKHKERLEALGIDILVDRNDLDQAERDLKRLVPHSLRFAIDTIGPETAGWCQNVLAARTSSRYSSPDSATPTRPPPVDTATRGGGSNLSHVVALTGRPKTTCSNVQTHTVPIKLFHTNRRVGGHLSQWLFELLDKNTLQTPEIEIIDGGLDSINDALARLEEGKASGKRLVVTLKGSNV